MTGVKTNERPGTRAVHRHCGMSASKARQVLDLIRGEDVQRAAEILTGTEREAAEVVGKVGNRHVYERREAMVKCSSGVRGKHP